MSSPRTATRRGGATVALALTCLAPLAHAQEAKVPNSPPTEVTPVDGVPGPDLPPKTPKAVTVGCCRCLGEVATVDLGTGAAPWVVKPPGAKVAVAATAIKTPHPAWVKPTAASPFTWVDDNGDGATTSNAVGTWTYSLQVIVPKDCVIPFVQPIKLTGNVTADDGFKLYVNGPPAVAQVGVPGGWAFKQLVPFTATLVPGVNTIKVEVSNTGGPTGMAFQARLNAPCVTDKPTLPTVTPPAVAPPKGITQSGIK